LLTLQRYTSVFQKPTVYFENPEKTCAIRLADSPLLFNFFTRFTQTMVHVTVVS